MTPFILGKGVIFLYNEFMKFILITLTLIVLFSCASGVSHKIVVLENSKKGYVITCYEDRENCENEAAQLCKFSYKVHSFQYKQSTRDQAVPMVNVGVDVQEDLGEYLSEFEMTVSCEDPKRLR